MKTADTLRSRLVKVKHAKQQEEGRDLRDTTQGLPLCVHWRDKKNLGETPKQRQSSGKKNDPKNGIAVHDWANQHQVNWEAASVKQEERSYWRRRVLEALHIHQQHRTLNLDCRLNINASWLRLLDKPPFPKWPPWPLTRTPHSYVLPPTLFFAIIQFIHIHSTIIRCLNDITLIT